MSGDVLKYIDFQVPPIGANLDYLFFNTRFSNFVNAVNGLASRQDGYDAAVSTLTSVGLTRINEVLGPLLNELQLAATTGFLTSPATSAPLSLSNSLAVAVTLTSPSLASFTPTPWLLLSDNNNINNWAILSFTSYSTVTGVLSGSCVYVNLPGTSSTNWTVSCQPAVIPAMQTLLASAQAASAAASAVAATVTANLATLNAAIAVIAGGPVASVAGRTGAVMLGIADIAALSTTLAGLASVAALNSGLATKQNSSSILSALAALSIAANTLPIGTGSGTLGLISCPPFGQNFISATNLATLATATGVATQSQLGPAAAKGLATAATILANTDTNPITTDQAWISGQWINLGNIAGNITINCNNGVRFYGTLTGNVTVTIQNLKSGQPLMLAFLQDSAGGHNVFWAGSPSPTIWWPNSSVPTVATPANGFALIASMQEFLGGIIANGWHM